MIEFLKSGPDRWTARSNAYTIERVTSTRFIVRDGHGRALNTEYFRNLKAAKTFATDHSNGVYAGTAWA